MSLSRAPKGEERKGQKSYLKKIMAKHFSNLRKERIHLDPEIPEFQMREIKRSTPRHAIL